MHSHDDQKKSLLRFLRIQHENLNIGVKNIIHQKDEAQLESRESDLAKVTTMDWANDFKCKKRH